MASPVVCIKNLNFAYDKDRRGNPIKQNINSLNCVVPPNCKLILVGANGAGKSTFLRILTGVVYLGLDCDEFDVNGSNKPADQANGVAYLGGVWKRRRTGFEGIEPFSMDIAAREMMKGWQEDNIERRDELVRVLGINLDWRMHQCSDGQRKKVRIMLKLLRPFQLCVIDEFASELDIFSRKRFFDYLSNECEKRNASVVYATHIFDQADVWASHVAFMQPDKALSPIHELKTYQPYQEILSRTGAERAMCPMYVLVLEELERQYRSSQEFFVEDNKCLADTIMEAQANEKEDMLYEEAAATAKNSGYESGRLARQEAIDDMKAQREERMAEKIKKARAELTAASLPLGRAADQAEKARAEQAAH